MLQWDDERIPLESGLALFDAFASKEKTLHANAGRPDDPAASCFSCPMLGKDTVFIR
ncbi:hypothetical protein AB0L65_05735 [Nonomuraea sp. NPDC052116]|uniref:hypothetical protein n=1 Tax=Nonomuraea sp. NPDC052116 TaxID=3155665 RepID=UPI0034357302